MTSSCHLEGDIMFFIGYGTLFSDKTYTTVVFMSFTVSIFIFGVCFSTFIYFSFEFTKKFQHVLIMDNRKWTITVFNYVIDMVCVISLQHLSSKINTILLNRILLNWMALLQLWDKKIVLVIGKRQWEVECEAVGPPVSEDKGRCHACISNLGWGRA